MKKKLSIAITRWLSILSAGYGKRFYPVEQRKAIYMEIIAAEDRAASEAEEKHPLNKAESDLSTDYIQKGLKLKQELQRKYVKEILEKYNINEIQERTLYAEALKESWLLD